MNKFLKNFFFFIIFCFFGYIWEVFYIYMRKGVLVNAGTMIGPWLPIYGAGGLIIYFIYKKVKTNTLGLFFISAAACSVIEYLTSFYLEKVYHMKWWDYSNKPFNLNGRIWLTGIIFFGLFALLCVKVILPILDKLYERIKGRVFNIVLSIIFIIFAVDFIYCTFNPNTDDAKMAYIYNNSNMEINLM